MKILVIADKEESLLIENRELMPTGEIDAILSCGDLQPEYLSRLSHIMQAPLWYVRGNHDIRYRSKPPLGCLDIHNRLMKLDGIKILGIEGSRWYNGGPAQYTENQMWLMLMGLRLRLWRHKQIDIIVTHAPPRNVHDAEDLCHRGFKSFHRLIARYRPRYFIHGHIHQQFNDPSERTTLVGQTRVVNAYGYITIEMENDIILG